MKCLDRRERELFAHGSDGAEPSSDHHADSRRRIAAKMAAATPASEKIQVGTSCNAWYATDAGSVAMTCLITTGFG